MNLADDSWVEGEMATRQLAGIARFRAIEQRLPLVRVAHGGLSTLIDPFGRTIEELPLDRYAHLRVTVRDATPPSAIERVATLLVPLTPTLGVWLAATRVRAAWRDRRYKSPPGGAGLARWL